MPSWSRSVSAREFLYRPSMRFSRPKHARSWSPSGPTCWGINSWSYLHSTLSLTRLRNCLAGLRALPSGRCDRQLRRTQPKKTHTGLHPVPPKLGASAHLWRQSDLPRSIISWLSWDTAVVSARSNRTRSGALGTETSSCTQSAPIVASTAPIAWTAFRVRGLRIKRFRPSTPSSFRHPVR